MLARRALLHGLAFVLALTSCSSSEGDAAPVEDTRPTTALAIYTGTVEGTDTRVGLVTENGAVALFFCGGEKSLTSTKWFRSSSVELKPIGTILNKDDWSTSLVVNTKSATGSVTMGKEAPKKWNLTRIPEGSIAGLYDYKDALGVGGVVVENEDLAQGAYIDAKPDGASPFAQIIVIRPVQLIDQLKIAVTMRGKPMTVQRVRPK